mmetsp:Transcript_18219/g.31579  ORF Transcript_18219/g.31579 Transcript_18219/m.31579 type:complete len:252 (+) Transcript_18219:134-889(+)
MIGFVSSTGAPLRTTKSASICTRSTFVSSNPQRKRSLVKLAEEPQSASATVDKVTEKVTEFADTAQKKIDEAVKYLQEVDPEELGEQTVETTKSLFTNFIGGEWLKRGEAYGAAQLVLAFLLLRDQPLLDGLTAFAVGPVTLFAGFYISFKALMDLGFKNLSIWPAPVEGGSLQTTGFYEKVRHPVYSGVLLASLGFANTTGSPAKFALTVALGVLFAKKIEVEEEFLEAKYPDYANYKEEVPYKLVPKIF